MPNVWGKVFLFGLGKGWGGKKVDITLLSHYLFATKMNKMRAAQALLLTIKSFACLLELVPSRNRVFGFFFSWEAASRVMPTPVNDGREGKVN